MATSGHLFLNSGGTATSDSLVMEDPSRILTTACGSHEIMSCFFFLWTAERVTFMRWKAEGKRRSKWNQQNQVSSDVWWSWCDCSPVRAVGPCSYLTLTQTGRRSDFVAVPEHVTTLTNHFHYLWRHTKNVPQVRHVTVSRLQLIMKKERVLRRKELQDVWGFFTNQTHCLQFFLLLLFFIAGEDCWPGS